MRLFAAKPEVAAYKSFVKDGDFKKIKLLSREIKVLEMKQGFAQLFKFKPKAERIQTKIDGKTVEMEQIKKSLAEKHDLKAVLASLKIYQTGFASGMRQVWEAIKIIVPTGVILSATFLGVGLATYSLLPPPSPSMTEAGKVLLSQLVGGTISIFPTFGYFFWKLYIRPSKNKVVEMAATPDKTRIDMPV